MSILITLTSFSQIDINSLNEIDKKIVKTFRDIYVEKKFKDPYSFELMKIETTPIKTENYYLSEIESVKSFLDKRDFQYVSESKSLEHLKTLELEYSQLNDSTKNTIKLYKVRLDSRGTNSYGGKVLGRYSFSYYLYSKNNKITNYYETPQFFFVTELDK